MNKNSDTIIDECTEAQRLIISANRIIIIGHGASAAICQYAYFRFTELGLNCVYNLDAHMTAALLSPAGQTLDCGLRLTAQRLFLWVQDSGPGFSPEALAKAGKLFYTEEPNRPQGGHLGMGLYSTAQTARAHGGGLCLENTSRGGRATLWISIS